MKRNTWGYGGRSRILGWGSGFFYGLGLMSKVVLVHGQLGLVAHQRVCFVKITLLDRTWIANLGVAIVGWATTGVTYK